ncbi:substrate-binding domain-containing protein [Azoarcus sp. KH32C]|uniref:helix-turn-helix transcriptional regulator n=1 Tax=Azoarcus sp. KH32C TaxID=748247 RepID=UPI0002386E5B|nr:substrate-binding domain-containing protein [Azoarcus sp. KH32C]BAL22833.1 molybdate metabolism transcriptional regulator [Azoarcus sp. KH32C]
MSVKLDYCFVPGAADALPERVLQLQNPLLAMLDAIHMHGTLGKAATELEVSYRHLWGELKRYEATFGQALIVGGQGRAAQLSEFGERLLWAEKRILARLLPQAESLAAQLDRELLLAINPALQVLRVCASHDLLFSGLRDALWHQAGVLLDVDYVGSAQALERLNAGACVLAGVHLPFEDEELSRRGSRIQLALGPELRLGMHKLIRFMGREQGLIVRQGNPLGLASLADLTRPGVAFVNRPRGSGTRLILDELLARDGIAPERIAGYATEEATHLSVAASVAAGHASCGFGLRAAADRFRLGFVPLVREQYCLVCLKEALDSEPVRVVLDFIRSPDFRLLVETLPGHDAEAAGEIVSLRRTLPWYK